MKHTVELKVPKLWNRKKKEEVEPEVKALEFDIKDINKHVITAGVAVSCLTIGYLVGHKNGASIGGTNITIIKD